MQYKILSKVEKGGSPTLLETEKANEAIQAINDLIKALGDVDKTFVSIESRLTNIEAQLANVNGLSTRALTICTNGSSETITFYVQ
jgi:hypothetical protein